MQLIADTEKDTISKNKKADLKECQEKYKIIESFTDSLDEALPVPHAIVKCFPNKDGASTLFTDGVMTLNFSPVKCAYVDSKPDGRGNKAIAESFLTKFSQTKPQAKKTVTFAGESGGSTK